MAMAQGSAWRGGGMIGWKRVAVLMHTSKRKPAEAGFLLTGPQSGIPFLHQRDGVADDQTVLVAIATCAIATESSVTPFDVQVLQRTFLEGVADIGVAFPLFAFRYAGTLEVVAAQVTGHEGQAGNADGCEVKVVAGLPGLLVFLSKVTNLYIVDQVGVDVTADIGKAGVAGHLLVAQAETVATERVGDHGTEGLVVDVGGAIVSRALVTQVRLQRLAFSDRQHMNEVQCVLLVEVFEVAVVVGGAQVLGDLVGAARINEFVGADVVNTGNTLTSIIDAHVFVVGGVPVVDLVNITQVQSQAVDFVGNQLGSAHCSR